MVTILIVDDTPANIVVLEELLAREDRLLLKATNGNDALKTAFEQEIDLIILDVQMPGLDGFEVSQILRSNKKTKSIPIIFASAVKQEHQSIMKGFEEGAVDYLLKPLDPQITKAKVSVLLKIQLQKKELVEKNESLELAKKHISQLNADLEKNLKQLQVLNEEMESFSYSVSHDLRAPLRAIHGYSSILEEDYHDKLDEGGKELLHSIRSNAERMQALIDDLLTFSRLGQKEVVKAEINTSELVENVIRGIGNNHKAQIKTGNLLNSYGDWSLLQQVWTNLINNAIKYSAKKDAPEIEISSELHGNDIVYTVKDNGAGFDMRYADKLFKVFQRLHSPRDFEGTGIGLATVHKIIYRHGGKIWAEAEENKGAAFSFTLPLPST